VVEVVELHYLVHLIFQEDLEDQEEVDLLKVVVLEEMVIHLQLVLLKEIMEELELIHLHLIYKLVVEVERQQLEQVVQVEELWELVEQEQILLLMQAQ
jgi:hypothetical protein